VVDRLAAVAAAVDHQPIAVGQAERTGQLRRHQHQMAEEVGVIVHDVGQRRNRPLRDHQHVDGRLRGDVVEGEAAVIVVDDSGRDFSAD